MPKTKEVKDESLDDTLLDLANYAVIVMCLREEAQQNKHLQKKGKDAGRTGEAGQAGEGA